MESLRLRNYRCFEDTGDIKLKPITLLVGANSSGKSSFLKFFPLLKQSIGIKKNGVFLWYSDDVDFKDFKNTVREGENKITIDMEIYQKTPIWRIKNDENFYNYIKEKRINNESVRFSLNLTISERNNNTDYLDNLIISYLDQKIEISYSKKNEVSILINGNNYGVKARSNSDWSGDLLPEILLQNEDGFYYRSQIVRDKICNIFNENGIDIEKEPSVFAFLFNPLYFISKTHFSEYLKRCLKNAQVDVDTLNNLYILNNLEDLVEMLNMHIKSIAMNTSYVKPLRVMPERYYRYQNYSVNEIASDGKNLAMYFANMTDKELGDFQKWTSNNFKFKAYPNKLEGHIEIDIKLTEGEEDDEKTENEKEVKGRNMIDTGFGYNQLLPILAIVWNSVYGRQRKYFSPYIKNNVKYIVIEQPELHLHPRVLAMFAEMICSVISKDNKKSADVRFIIETHSETIINKIGSLIMSKKVDDNNVNVVLFNAKDEGLNNYIEQAAFDEKGYLNNWPIGFFL